MAFGFIFFFIELVFFKILAYQAVPFLGVAPDHVISQLSIGVVNCEICSSVGWANFFVSFLPIGQETRRLASQVVICLAQLASERHLKRSHI